MRIRPSLPLVILVILTFEKFIQHTVVSYAFWRNASGIRESVAVDYRILLISGFLVGILFMINIPFHMLGIWLLEKICVGTFQ